METLITLDKALFNLLNFKLTHPLLDIIMPWITEPRNFRIPLVLAGLVLIVLGGKKERKTVLLILLALVITDQTSSWLKGLIQRIRPCNIEDVARVLVGCTHSFSMPSSHAANIAAASTILSFFYIKLSPIFIATALLVVYSRVYVGAHYPFDVIAGTILGLSLSFCILTLEKKLTQLKTHRGKR